MHSVKRFERKRSKETWDQYFARISKDYDEVIRPRRERKRLV